MIAIDTDVLAIHHIFTWDRRFHINSRFLRSVKEPATTIHNLIELCSLVSRALSPSRSIVLFKTYMYSSRWNILFPRMPSGWEEYVDTIFPYISDKAMSYGDALIAWTLEEHSRLLEAFITWNTKDFKDKINVPVYTPKEWLERQEKYHKT